MVVQSNSNGINLKQNNTLVLKCVLMISDRQAKFPFETQHFGVERSLRFGLCIPDTGDIVEDVFNEFDELERVRRAEREVMKLEINRLAKENRELREAYFNQFYNKLEIEKAWIALNNWNRPYLELHEAIQERLRELQPIE
jgi:hypothetical protein